MEEPKILTRRQPKLKKRIILGAIMLLVGGGILIGYKIGQPDAKPQQSAPVKGPVPASVKSAVKFTIYYPEQAKLPKGYTLDTGSFKVPQDNGVTYNVTYPDGKKIVFSLQPKPTDKDMETFLGDYIPLRTSVDTPLGKAEIGAYNTPGGDTQTLGSWTATKDDTWIIFTAPYDTDQDNLAKVLKSLKY